MVAKGAVIRIDGEPNFNKPIEYQDLIRSIKEENEKNIACAERELEQLATENADVDYVMNIVIIHKKSIYYSFKVPVYF